MLFEPYEPIQAAFTDTKFITQELQTNVLRKHYP